MSLNEIVKTMQDAVNRQTDQAKPGGYDTTATVRRIEGDTAFVHIPGGVDETPVKLTINAKAGDNVQVRVSGGNAFLVGNGSAPPTDDARANQAYTVATVAEGAAENALANAARAAEAADSAQASATRAESAAGDAVIAAGDAQTAAGNAQTAADTALVNLATTEDVVGVLNWITAHGTMTTQSGGVFVPGQVYFISDPAGDYVVGGNHYSVVPEPKADDIDSYYILTVNESVQNYVATHIVVDSEGLWIIPDAGGNKVLIATGSGSTYTTAGTYIVGKVGGVDTVLASFTANGATVGLNSEGNTEFNSSGVTVKENGLTLANFTSSGAVIGQSSGNHVSVDSTSVDINNGSTMLATFGSSGAQIGKSGASHSIIDANGQRFYASDGTTQLANIGYGSGQTQGGGTATAPYYTFGERFSGSTIGNYSIAEGSDIIASGAESHAEGRLTQANGFASHAEGYSAKANGAESHAGGYGTTASKQAQTVIGTFNVEDTSSTTTHPSGSVNYGKYAVIIGNGTWSGSQASNALTVDWSGNVEAAGDITDGSSNVLSNKQDKLTAADLAKPSITKTSGNSTCTVREYAGYGKVRMLTLSFKTTAAVSAGSNVFVGTLTTTSALPIFATSGCGYFGSSAVIATIGATGTITVRNISAQIANAQEPYVYFTYIVS